MDVCNTEQSSKHVVIQEDISQFGQKCTVTFLCYCGGDKNQLLNVIKYH